MKRIKKNLNPKLLKHCREKLENYKIPVKIYIENQKQYSDRFKKIRKINVIMKRDQT